MGKSRLQHWLLEYTALGGIRVVTVPDTLHVLVFRQERICYSGHQHLHMSVKMVALFLSVFFFQKKIIFFSPCFFFERIATGSQTPVIRATVMARDMAATPIEMALRGGRKIGLIGGLCGCELLWREVKREREREVCCRCHELRDTRRRCS